MKKCKVNIPDKRGCYIDCDRPVKKDGYCEFHQFKKKQRCREEVNSPVKGL